MTKFAFLLRKLRDDRGGNIMYMTAGLLIPIMATVGAGVDLGQAYMAKSRLQQACDAGVLAGRRSMADGVFGTDDEAAARRMFNFNYPAGIYGSTGITFTPTAQGTSEVTGTASASVSTIVMKVFGRTSIALTANCTAKLEISNADIMFVLDVTGSMAQTNSGDSVSKIQALKNEVMSFYDTIAAAQDSSSIIRYGVVPYSSNVNVGRILFASDPTWISTNLTVPSRTGSWVNTSTTGPSTAWSDSSGFSTYANVSPSQTISQSSSNCAGVVPSPQYVNGTVSSGPTTNTTVTGTSPRTTTTTVDTYYNATKYRYNYNSSACRLQQATGIRLSRATTTVVDEYRYNYQTTDFNVAGLLAGSALNVASGTNGATVSASWNGCIMERDTVPFASDVAVPAAAYDLDVDLIPNSEATRWHIAVPNIVHPRASSPGTSQTNSPTVLTTTSDYASYASSSNTSGGWAACPAEARKLSSISRADMQTYINTLQPIGGTYHDVGMIWGTRLLSPTGLYADENSVAANGNPISRHIIFMTDGDMAPNAGIYGFQGQEYLQGRVAAGNTSDLTNRHNARFLAACNAAKSRNMTVWVVGFGTSLNSNLTACASGDKAYQASNAAQLHLQFQAIAAQITRLRLSQ